MFSVLSHYSFVVCLSIRNACNPWISFDYSLRLLMMPGPLSGSGLGWWAGRSCVVLTGIR